MSKVGYSETFLNSNIQYKELAKSFLYIGKEAGINKAIDNKIKVLYLDNNNFHVQEQDGLFSIVLDHYVYKRIIEGKFDKGIGLFLNRIIDIAYSRKRVYILNLFLAFNLGRDTLDRYLSKESKIKLDEIEGHRNTIEKMISNIIKIENGRVYFDNGKDIREQTFLEYLIVNIPTNDKAILRYQEMYYITKMKKLFLGSRVEKNQVLLLNGKPATIENMNVDNLLLHFITRYNFYDELGNSRYYENSPDKSLIRDDIVFNYCSSFEKSNGFAFYNPKSLSGNFSLENNLGKNVNFLFILLAARHEARHAVQWNCKSPDVSSLKDAHFASIMFRIDKADYSTNYCSQTIEHDANRKAFFVIASFFKRIGYSDIADFIEKSKNEKIRDLLFEVRTDKNGITEDIWEHDGKIIDGLTTSDLNKYPELRLLFENNGQHKRLIELFKINLDIKGRRLFESSFMNNYIRYRALHSYELDEIISYLLQNNINIESTFFLNINGVLFNYLEEIDELTKNVFYVLDRWMINISSNKRQNNVRLVNPFFSRIETLLQILSKMKVLSSKYPLVDRRIKEIEKVIMVMIDNVINHYNKLRVSYEVGKTSHEEFIKAQYRHLLFVNKLEYVANNYLSDKMKTKVLEFKMQIVCYFKSIIDKIKKDETLSNDIRELLFEKCSINTEVANIRSTEQFSTIIARKK